MRSKTPSGKRSDLLKGSSWLYLKFMSNYATGMLYWFLISRIIGASPLGVVGTILGISGIVTTSLQLGIPESLQKFVGKCKALSDEKCIASYYTTALLFILSLSLSASIIIFLSGRIFLHNLNTMQLGMVSLFVLLGWISVPNALLLSLLKTKEDTIAYIMGNLFKITLGFLLVMLGNGWLGALLGYLSSNLVVAILLTWSSKDLLLKHAIFSLKYLYDQIKAGLSLWIPNFLEILGQQLGIIYVFDSIGSKDSGLYFLSLSIVNLALTPTFIMASLLIPVLSGMDSGRQELTDSIIETAYALSAPLGYLLMAYPKPILWLFGKSFMGADKMISELGPSVLLLIIPLCIRSYVFSTGNYKLSIIISASYSLPRVILYPMLIPVWGGIGAARSYLLGSFIGLLTSISMGLKFDLFKNKDKILKIVSIPLILWTGLIVLSVPNYFGVLILSLSYLIYLKLKLLNEKDLKILINPLLNVLHKQTIKRLRRYA